MLLMSHDIVWKSKQIVNISNTKASILKRWTKLEIANFSHPFYGTPRLNTFITF